MILPTEHTYWIFRAIFVLAWITALARAGYLLFLLSRGKKENRLDNIASRIIYFIKNVVFGMKIFEEPLIGCAHLMIFWGFLCFCVVSTNAFLEGIFPGVTLPVAEWPVVIYTVDIFAGIVGAGLLIAAVRRYIFKPERLENTLDAFTCLFLIFFLMITYVFAEAFLYNAVIPFHGAKGLIGAWLSGLIANIGPARAQTYYIWTWWAHALCLLLFLNYIFFSKHLHLAACPFNSFFAKQSPAGILPKQKDDEYGAATVYDFTWKDLLDGFTCSECGRCDRNCPAYNSGDKLSPKMMMHGIKEYLLKEGAQILRCKTREEKKKIQSIIGNQITKEELWGCLSCYSCVQRCPVSNNHIDSIVKMRRRLINDGEVDDMLNTTLMNFSRYGNSFGKSERMRAKWAQELGGIKIKDARKEEVEYLWFVGDYASYDGTAVEATKQLARILTKAGVSFGILYEAERNAGNDVRRIGEEGCFEMLLEKNIAALSKAKFKKIVTTDPHTYNTLKNEYPEYGAKYEVYHYTELIKSLINSGKITIDKKLDYAATYHDPCYLGRYNGIFDPPRDVIKKLGLTLTEMPRNRSHSYCCGAGGGKIWMEEVELKERPSEGRIKEAVSLKGVNYFVVACPKDLSMFKDAVKATGNEGKMFVKDIAELIAESFVVEKSEVVL